MGKKYGMEKTRKAWFPDQLWNDMQAVAREMSFEQGVKVTASDIMRVGSERFIKEWKEAKGGKRKAGR